MSASYQKGDGCNVKSISALKERSGGQSKQRQWIAGIRMTNWSNFIHNPIFLKLLTYVSILERDAISIGKHNPVICHESQ